MHFVNRKMGSNGFYFPPTAHLSQNTPGFLGVLFFLLPFYTLLPERLYFPGMNTPPKNETQQPVRQTAEHAVDRLLSALDKSIAAADEARQARDDLSRAVQEKGSAQ